MSFLALGLLRLHHLLRIATSATPVHLRDGPLLLERVIGVALMLAALMLCRRVDSAVLTSTRQLHRQLLRVDLPLAANVLELLIVLEVVFATLAFRRALGLLLLREGAVQVLHEGTLDVRHASRVLLAEGQLVRIPFDDPVP